MTRSNWCRTLFLATLCSLFLSVESQAGDWIHWRGPEQMGFARDTGLPSEFEPFTPGKDNLVWKAPVGFRSTPILMGGKMYVTSTIGDVPRPQSDAEKLVTGERIVCMDAGSGKVLWEQRFNVFLADIVTSRLGWAPLSADPETKKIYAHTSGGFLVCLDGETGKILWQRQLTEEFGRVTGYGGRVSGPIVDSGLVIVSLAHGSWGAYARGAGRFVAMDQDTGNVVWWGETPFDLIGTYNSNPVVATIGGQRLLISGSADGAIHAFQVRTGKRIWSYKFSAGVINPSPLVVGNLVFCAHGEVNPEGGDIGRVICLDASKLKTNKDGLTTPELVWQYRDGTKFGLASPASDGKFLYMPDDAGKLYCFDIAKEPTGAAKTNKFLWKFNYGTLTRGSPLIADNKVFITGVDARFVIIELNGKKVPEKSHDVKFKAPPGGTGLVEVHSTPAAANGRVFFGTRDECFCIGTKEGKAGEVPAAKNQETPAQEGEAPAQLQIYPADAVTKAGDKPEFQLRAYTAKGVPLPMAKLEATWSLPFPPAPKAGGVQPSALDATIDPATGTVTINAKKPAQHGLVMAKVGGLTAMARVRVVAQIPYKQDFSLIPLTVAPSGWVNTQGKYSVVEKDGNKVLFKVNTNPAPPVARAYAFITSPTSTGYTIEADLMGIEKKDKLGDGGVMANRYTFYLDGKTDEKGDRTVRLISWEALPRINVGAPFTWKAGTWYRLKLTVEVGEKESLVRAKVWDRSQPEPEKWTIEFKDPLPNREGAAALYGYVSNADAQEPGSEIYYDNVSVTPTSKK